MADIVVVLIITVLILRAVICIIRDKKRGRACPGCSGSDCPACKFKA